MVELLKQKCGNKGRAKKVFYCAFIVDFRSIKNLSSFIIYLPSSFGHLHYIDTVDAIDELAASHQPRTFLGHKLQLPGSSEDRQTPIIGALPPLDHEMEALSGILGWLRARSVLCLVFWFECL